MELAKAYGPTPAWHDVQVAIQGPAVHDVETTFRERWEDSTPLTVNPGRLLSSLFHREDLSAEPLGDQSPPPAPRPDGHDIVQIVRTFPVIAPKGFDFAPEGERSVMLSNTKAIAHADRLVYVEDQYLWSDDVGEHFAAALRDKPDLRLVVVLPMVPDLEGAVAEVPQLYGRSLAMRTIIEAGGDRVAVFGLCNDAGLPIYVHSKTCVIDHRWASVGSDNLNRRSWTGDSEIACTVVDDRGDLDQAAPEDAFPRVLLRTLVAEHLGCEPDDVPEDPHELFDAMVACAEALDQWYGDGSPDPQERDPRAAPGPDAPPHRADPPLGGGPRPGPSEATRTGPPPRRAPCRRARAVLPGGCAVWRRRSSPRPSWSGHRVCTTCCSTRTVDPTQEWGTDHDQEEVGHRRLECRPAGGPARRPGLRPRRDGPRGDPGLGGRQEGGQEVRRRARRPPQRAAGAAVRRGTCRRHPRRCW